MRLSAHRRDERDRRVDVVPVHPDIHVAAVLPLDAEPVDEARRSRLPDAFQHVAPALERHAAAPLKASADRLDPPPGVAVQLGRLVVEPGGQTLRQFLQRRLKTPRAFSNSCAAATNPSTGSMVSVSRL